MRTNKKRNKKAIIITAIAMLTGILLVLAGIFGGSVAALFIKSIDLGTISPDDVGKTIQSDVKVLYDRIDVPDMTLQNCSGDWLGILLDFSDADDEDESLYYSKWYMHVTIQGTIRTVDDEELQKVAEAVYKNYDYIYYEKMGLTEDTYKETSDLEYTLDDFHQRLYNRLPPYCVDVKSVGHFNWIPFIPAGACIFLIALAIEICLIFKLKKRIALPIIYGLMIIIPAVMLFNHIRTMLTVNKVTDGFYTMKNLECTDTKDMLESGSSTANDLLDWIFDKHLYGAPNFFNIDDDSIRFGCSAFSAVTPEGDHLFGRNFDLYETDTVLIHSHPEGAYESIGVAFLGIFGVGQNSTISPDSPLGKLVMVITPYVVVDGMNEKGVAAGILELSGDKMIQDKGNPDLLIYCAIRGILDTCASVDEALALLESYDINSDLGSYHLFITDRSGRYAVVEWLDGEMVVIEHPCCTNSIIAPGEYYDTGLPDGRKSVIEECLGSDLTASEKEAMDILAKVKNIEGMTEWSCVYNLDDFTVDICIDADFENVYTFSSEDLG